jgi:NADPH:quinone reductase
MKAARIHTFGGPDVFRLDEDLLVPEPSQGEVLVQIKAAGVNFFDTELRGGGPIPSLPLPHTLGLDGAGIISSAGPGVDTARVGQQVVIYPNVTCGDCGPCVTGYENRCQNFSLIGVTRPGTYAGHIAVPARNAIAFESMTFEEAASVPMPWTAAWHLLRKRVAIQPGQTLLVVGAGGGVGSAAVQIGRLSGAHVFAATSGAAKMRRLEELGAEAVFDYHEGDPWQDARRRTGGRGVDFVLDYGGSKTVGRSVAALAPGGSVLIVGSVTGDILPELDLRGLYFNHLSLVGSSSGTREDLRQVLTEMKRGSLQPVHDRSFPLAEAGEAHKALASPNKFGRITLIP